MTAAADRKHGFLHTMPTRRVADCPLWRRVTLPGQSESLPHQRCPFAPQMLIVGKTVQAAPVPAPGIDRLPAALDPSSTSSMHTVYHAGASTVEHFRSPWSPSQLFTLSRGMAQLPWTAFTQHMTLLSSISKQSNSSDSLKHPNGSASRPGTRTRLWFFIDLSFQSACGRH
ncbi:hypothetical protein BU25DRAFT_245688 [Macroventuria anomochaeta]|uniref:Uncharacterized protein n=1 Tax=Macroventuria anomochaeta TaxID=301207 RepID=A0ACB6S9M5_9PLEO|nr:uncharacterized protein BU25DRAFT_245688 [Macroventuria anomochaeta]KAF2630707.1 hypothetical protein BU25DRAFT_245688 [Macroventuria anomochaeta]